MVEHAPTEPDQHPGSSDRSRPSVEDRLAAVERRLAELEGRPAPDPTPAARSPGETAGGATPDPGSGDPMAELDGETFWALHGLRARSGEDGAVLFTGWLELPNGERYAWQQGASANQLMDLEWPERATALAALAHPVRLRLLQFILLGVRTTAELTGVAEVNTSGQLHHHLKELAHAGWLVSPRRGAYTVPAQRVVPLLTIIQAAGALS